MAVESLPKVKLYKCNGDCFNCIHEDCIVDNEKEIMGHTMYLANADDFVFPKGKPKLKKINAARYSPLLHMYIR